MTLPQEPIIIKKYANRRLYDLSKSQYVTLEDLSHLIHQGKDIIVQDAKTKQDITRSVLTQIILEQEGHGNHLFPLSFLKDVIGFYADTEKDRPSSPLYWETVMSFFKENRNKIHSDLTKMLEQPFSQLQKITDHHNEILQNSFSWMNMFNHKDKDKVTISKAEYEQLKADNIALKTNK